ncbi:MAG: hypothetical protein Fues2KO_39430 [Fuerstiella sp.]
MAHRMLLFLSAMCCCCCSAVAVDRAWVRHTIDDGSQGADGVRLGDMDQDGRVDIVTGWEEGGAIRICFGPQTAQVRSRWPVAQIGSVKSPEDAVFADVTGDGWLDVVSCCEGKTQTVFLHISPGESGASVRDARRWQTIPVQSTVGLTRWMFCQPLPDGRLVLGSKNPNGQIAIAKLDADGQAELRVLRRCGWIMSLVAEDLDRDGDVDIVYSDRRGPDRGIGWLENNGVDWTDHPMGGHDVEPMFLKVVRQASAAEQTDEPAVFCDTKQKLVLQLSPDGPLNQPWLARRIPRPQPVGSGKAVAVGDIDGDGVQDVVCSCEHAGGVSGVYWMPVQPPDSHEVTWEDISGTDEGVKFDRLELIDIDKDGDLDVLTCEERDGLGVVWYENPHNRAIPPVGKSSQ